MSEPTWDDMLGPAIYYMSCGACDADVLVTEAQWDDTTVHVVGHEGCLMPFGGVDLDHARRHAD